MRKLLQGILLAAAMWPGTSNGQVVINEILPSPDGIQEEFVELLNKGDASVPVEAISFRDSRSGWIPVNSGSSLILEPGAFLVLSAGTQPAWPAVDFVYPTGWASLNNSGDSVLVRVGTRVTDRLGYDDNERGRSLERLDPAVPGHVAGNWAPSAEESGGTPGRINTRYRPDDTPPRLLAAEFSPPSSLILWLSEPVAPASLTTFRMELDGSTVTTDDAVLQEAHVLFTLGDGPAPHELTVGGLFDFAGHPMPDTTVSVAVPASSGDALLSELLVRARSGPNDLPEFVEITARSDRPVSLRKARLTIGAGPEPDVVPFSEPDSTRIIDPGDVLVMVASPETGPVALHNRALIEAALADRLGPVKIMTADPSDIALRNSGDVVRIVSTDGRVIDAAEYDPDQEDIRFGDHAGRSIRRVGISRPDGLSWVSTLDESGSTPGVPDTVSTPGTGPQTGDLMFSELMPRPLADPGDGRPDQSEYIEVANVSGRPIDLSGLMISGPVADHGGSDRQRIVYQPLILEPDRVAVIYELPGAVGDATSNQFTALSDAFPSVYPAGVGFGQIEASLGRGGFLSDGHGLLIPVRGAISLKDDGETLRLLSASGVVIDSVEYMPAMHHPAVADPTGRALERTVLFRTPITLGGWSTSVFPGGGSPGLLPPRPGPPPSPPDTGPRVHLEPKTISPDGDGLDDRTILLADNLEHGTVVRVDVYDIDGRRVRTLIPGTIAHGTFSAEWSGLDDERRPVARGFYVILVQTAATDARGGSVFKLPVAVVR